MPTIRLGAPVPKRRLSVAVTRKALLRRRGLRGEDLHGGPAESV